jgi:hypothetical protein
MAFDKMIEAAANAPRRFGLAPKTNDLFKTHAVGHLCFSKVDLILGVACFHMWCLLSSKLNDQ